MLKFDQKTKNTGNVDLCTEKNSSLAQLVTILYETCAKSKQTLSQSSLVVSSCTRNW